MGQTLSAPVTSKESAYCQNEKYKVGSSCMQGWRIHMEDSHTHILSLPDDPDTAFFAVYDGHGGANVAKYAGKNLHKYIIKRPEYQTDISTALKQAFLDFDDAMRNDKTMQEQMAGSTAVTCLVKDNFLYCANAGDSRMIACVNGQVKVLSVDHKPNSKIEQKRIYNAGGYVEYNRVNGNLALSRALGDFIFKRNTNKIPEEQIVTAYPDVVKSEITEDWEFAVLACDGIWDVLQNVDVTNFCRKRIGLGMEPEQICEELMELCLAPDCQMGGLGGDNMTVILILFLHNKPYEELVQKCSVPQIPEEPLNSREFLYGTHDNSSSEDDENASDDSDSDHLQQHHSESFKESNIILPAAELETIDNRKDETIDNEIENIIDDTTSDVVTAVSSTKVDELSSPEELDLK